ncbi:MAG TPA: Sec-independent protein translocase subunit TatA [Mycobacteriales bacterium]|nr:Sec-independent protein translocase subunit TatA [Mycobacteriales bacterium]
MLGLGAPELIIIALVVLALFGYKKLPDASRAIGRSLRILKAETKGLRDDPAPRDLQARAEAEYLRHDVRAEQPAPPPAPPPAPAPAPPQAAAPPPAAATPAPAPAPAPPQSETR